MMCKLEDVAKICDNQRKPINSSERSSRIANKPISMLYPYYGATGQVGYIDEYLIDGTYILLGEDGAPFLDRNAEKAYIIEGKAWVNNHAHILQPYWNIRYLCHYLNTFIYDDYVNGSTRLKLTQADMRNIPVALPPLREQNRIADAIQSYMSVLNRLQNNL